MQASLTVRGVAPKKLVDRLLQLGRKMPTLAAELATVTMVEIDRTYGARQDPYGRAWRPTKCRDNPVLELTGALRGSISVMPSARGFSLSVTDRKADWHHRGRVIRPKRGKYLRWHDACGWHKAKKVKLPARPLIPRKGQLPASWRKAYKTRFQAMCKETIG